MYADFKILKRGRASKTYYGLLLIHTLSKNGITNPGTTFHPNPQQIVNGRPLVFNESQLKGS